MPLGLPDLSFPLTQCYVTSFCENQGLYLQDQRIRSAALLKPLHFDAAVVWVMTGYGGRAAGDVIKQSQAKRGDLLD